MQYETPQPQALTAQETTASGKQGVIEPTVLIGGKPIEAMDLDDFDEAIERGEIELAGNTPDIDDLYTFENIDKYDKKLREKMEETAIAEKRERERQREMDKARMLGGIASIVPGVGPIIGSGIEMVAQEKIRIKDALNGGTRSSTILMQEVQMLMQKWQRINEMVSNLLKSLHDMAMTSIRNLRG